MKWLALLLLVLNVWWAAWAQEALTPWGWGPSHDQQPERFERQLRSDALQPLRSPP